MIKKFLRIMTVLFLVLPLLSCGQEAQASDDIYIFYTADVHCGVTDHLGFPKAMALIEDTKAEHKNVALVDLGDYLQGGVLGAFSRGESVIAIMNAMHYDAAVIGNHEFDYGVQRLKELMDMADFAFTACNIRYSGSGENLLKDVPPYVMKDFDGVKVAFVGIATPYTISTSTPVYFQEDGQFVYDFCRGDEGMELAEQVQKTVDQARADGARYVIALAHLGVLPNLTPYDSVSLIHHTNGIDAVLDGHAHVTVIGDFYPNKDGQDVLLSSVGTKMENLGELIISRDGTITTVLHSEYDREDETIAAKITEEQNRVSEVLNEKVGETAFDLRITDENGIRICRSRECTIGNFVTDAYRAGLGCDIVLLNGGALRDSLPAGDITYGSLLSVCPFMNTLSIVNASGQQILDALESGARDTQSLWYFDEAAVGEFGGFLQVSGLKYTIDTSVPSGIRVDENGLVNAIEGERRVKDVYVLEGEEYVPLDPQKMYTVGSIRYNLQDNGDGNTAFADAEVILEGGMTDIDVLISYVRQFETMPERYADTEGRITVY